MKGFDAGSTIKDRGHKKTNADWCVNLGYYTPIGGLKNRVDEQTHI